MRSIAFPLLHSYSYDVSMYVCMYAFETPFDSSPFLHSQEKKCPNFDRSIYRSINQSINAPPKSITPSSLSLHSRRALCFRSTPLRQQPTLQPRAICAEQPRQWHRASERCPDEDEIATSRAIRPFDPSLDSLSLSLSLCLSNPSLLPWCSSLLSSSLLSSPLLSSPLLSSPLLFIFPSPSLG